MTRRWMVALAVGVAVAALVEPAFAQGTGGGAFQPVDNALNMVVQALQGAFARSAAILAVMVLGFLALAGRLSWFLALSICMGIALIFGAASIVDALKGSVGT